MSERKRVSLNLQANLIAGVLTVLPILVVWVVIGFLLGMLSWAGAPVAQALTQFVQDHEPSLAPVLADPAVQWIVAVAVALLLLYAIGAVASRVIGMRLIAMFEAFIARIPIVQSVYDAAKQLVGVLRQKPGSAARVVLVDFPQPGMKAIGLVMRTFTETKTGEEIAAVYVPTAPNPTSGYLELLPAAKLMPIDMSVEQAMAMIVSGGAVGPSRIDFGPRGGAQ